MACFGCGSNKWKLGVCRCHELLDNDKKKRLVRYCSICGVWLCRSCLRDPIRRLRAFGRTFFESIGLI